MKPLIHTFVHRYIYTGIDSVLGLPRLRAFCTLFNVSSPLIYTHSGKARILDGNNIAQYSFETYTRKKRHARKYCSTDNNLSTHTNYIKTTFFEGMH